MNKDIEEMIKNRRYDDIFKQYGRDIFLKYVPKQYRKMDIKRLVEEERYEDIYLKYGEKAYNRVVYKAMYNEIKETKGKKEANIWKVKTRFLKFLRALGLTTVFGLAITTSGSNNESFQNIRNEISAEAEPIVDKIKDEFKEFIELDETNIKDWDRKNIFTQLLCVPIAFTIDVFLFWSVKNFLLNLQLGKYKNEVEEYKKQVSKYAKNVNRMNLKDIQVFMKLMNDMWDSIQGYKPPKLFNETFAMMDFVLATKDGYGICRNMAPYVARRLNEINPKYNARVANVYFPIGAEGYKIANIERKFIEDSMEELEGIKKEAISTLMMEIGNHAIVLIDSPQDNAILALDPTNPGIGILIDGYVYMFNEPQYKHPTYELKSVVTTIYENFLSTESITKIKLTGIKDYNTSWKYWSGKNFDALRKKYSLEEQNKALEEVRRIESVGTLVKDKAEVIGNNQSIINENKEGMII